MKVTVTATGVRFSAPRLTVTPAEMRAIGGMVIAEDRKRILAGRGSDDSPMRAYSSRGPIYIPITSRGRSKSQLGGREVITPADIRKAKSLGRTAGKSRTGRSMKFANYAAYKKWLGKPGWRNLELSGRMLNAIGIVAQRPNEVVVGFLREQEERKARGNERLARWWSPPPSTRDKVLSLVKQIFDRKLRSAS